MVDFTKLKIAGKNKKVVKKAKKDKVVEVVAEVEQPVKSWNKKLPIPDPSLAEYKKVFQYCEDCKVETISDIIANDVICKVCTGKYRLSPRVTAEPKSAVLNDFLLIW